MALGVDVLERETFHSAISLGEKALVALGHSREEAQRLANAFEAHDEKLLLDSYALRGDRDAYIGFVRRTTEMLDAVMQADRERAAAEPPAPGPQPPAVHPAAPASDVSPAK
jgi:glutathione-regulated potassium-efflux system ancillary protein KefC